MRSLSLLAVAALAAPLAAQDTLPGVGNYSLPPAGQATPAPVPSPTPVPTPTPTAAEPPAIPLPRLTAAPREAATPTPRPTPTATPTPRASATPTVVASPAATPTPTPTPAASPTPVATPAPVADEGMPLWPIAAGLLALAAIAAVLLWRRRRPALPALAHHEPEPLPPAPEPIAEPEPRPAPAFLTPAPPPVPTERAWLDVTVRATRAGVNMATATAEVEIEVVNAGTGPARAVRVGAALLSARSGQDDELGRLFAQPVARPAVAPFDLAPGEATGVKLLATLPRTAINVLDAGGRPMFVPIVAVNVVYEIGGGAIGQTAAAHAIGIARDGADKLGPFWLDGPNRMHDHLGSRPHALALRS